MGKIYAPYAKKQYSVKVDIIHQFPEHHIPIDAFFAIITNLDGLVKLLVDESNLCDQQSGREFQTKEQEVRIFSGINYIISINKLLISINKSGNSDVIKVYSKGIDGDNLIDQRVALIIWIENQLLHFIHAYFST